MKDKDGNVLTNHRSQMLHCMLFFFKELLNRPAQHELPDISISEVQSQLIAVISIAIKQ